MRPTVRIPDLQRRHYAFIAEILHDFLVQEGAHILFGDQLVAHFSQALKATSINFDGARFIKAANPRHEQ